MAQLILPAHEALALARQAGALPGEFEEVRAQGDTLTLGVNARERLPRLLRGLSPTVTVTLRFERFAAGRAAFRVETALRALPLTALTQLLLKLVSLPELRGVAVVPEGGELRLWVDLQGLLGTRLRGLELTDFRLAEGRFVLEADLCTLTLPVPAPKESR